MPSTPSLAVHMITMHNWSYTDDPQLTVSIVLSPAATPVQTLLLALAENGPCGVGGPLTTR
jgi:hypothetical protein